MPKPWKQVSFNNLKFQPGIRKILKGGEKGEIHKKGKKHKGSFGKRCNG
jgi:hypothetical protein